MRISLKVLLGLVLLVILMPLGAQVPLGQRPKPEEVRSRIEAGLASTYDAEKLAALEELALAHGAKTFTDLELVNILEGVLILGSNETDYNNPLLLSLAPVRIKALTVLDRVQSREAHLVLLRVCEGEIDDIVVEQAMINARNLTLAPSIELINAMVRILKDPYAQAPHDKLMIETMKTVGLLHQKYSNMATRALYDAIINLSEHPRYLQITRKTAQNLIRQLAGSR